MAGKIVGQAIHQGAGRPRQQDEPEDYGENMAMRCDQRFLHCEAGNLGGIQAVGGTATPFAEQ